MAETNQLQIKFKRSPVYSASKKAFFERWPIICNEGGSRSGKTYSVIQLLIIIAAIKQPGVRISIVSHSLPHIKRGAYRDFKTIMDEWKIWSDDDFSYSDFVYTFKNGSYIELFGLEDESKARGPGRDILFINEANLITKALFDQLAMRTTGQIFLDWNPADFNSWVYEVADDPKNKRIHSTYRNNLSNLSETQVSLIESYKNLPDDFMWKVYGLGERGAAKELIYTQWKMYDEEPENGDVFYGLDFGYTNPAALVKVRHYDGANYVEEVLYRSGLTNQDLVQFIKQLGIGQSPIYADCAEPKSIEELYKAGLNVLPSDKDVWAGIVGVKSYPLHVKRTSVNLIEEMQGYKWKKDKNDNILEEPIKMKDHLCFVGETLVLTDSGYRQICSLNKGDRVYNSSGVDEVVELFDNGVHYVVKYVMHFDTFSVSLECTPNHLIKTDSTWMEISQLQSGMTVNLSNILTEEFSNFSQRRSISIQAHSECTSTFGGISTGRFLKDSTCTTKTRIHGITELKTLNWLNRISTNPIIQRSGLSKTQNGLKSSSKMGRRVQKNGMGAKKELSGTKNMQSEWVLENQKSRLRRSANNVEMNLKIGANIKAGSFAIQTAKLRHLEKGIKRQERVYDLKIKNRSEYIANGVLVHNCDAMRYAIFTHLTRPVFGVAVA